MYNASICASRLKQLRTNLGLKHTELSRYCTILGKIKISQSTLSFWENLKTTPAIDNLQFVADIFGVSLDWLVGRSDERYTENTCYFLEPKLFPVTITVCDTTIDLPIEIPEDYKNYELRKQTYSLETRAHIIFLFYVLSYEWERYVGDRIYEFADKNISDIKLHAYKMFHYFMKNQSDKSKITGYRKNLEDIFRTKSV